MAHIYKEYLVRWTIDFSSGITEARGSAITYTNFQETKDCQKILYAAKPSIKNEREITHLHKKKNERIHH